MPGFRISNVKADSELIDKYPERCITDSISGGFAQWQTLNKFMQDKTFEETEDLIVIEEGYLLNKTVLFEKYGAATVAELVTIMLKKNGEPFFSEFHGCFSGAVYMKAEDKWIREGDGSGGSGGDKDVFQRLRMECHNSMSNRVALKRLYPQRCVAEVLTEDGITIERRMLRFCSQADLQRHNKMKRRLGWSKNITSGMNPSEY